MNFLEKLGFTKEEILPGFAVNDTVKNCLRWVRGYKIKPGLVIKHRSSQALPLTQETTGYMIKTLRLYEQTELAKKLMLWEVSNQRPDGAFIAVDKIPYTFDTAQVIRGFLSLIDEMPELMDNLRRACDYVASKIAPNGEVLHDSYETWKFPDGSMLSEYGNLYVLPPLLQAGEKLKEPRYVEAARRSMDYYRQKPDLVEFKPEMSMISHYLGYMMEALVELGEVELAKKGLAQAEAIQKTDGSIPAYPGANWVCSTGMAQLSIAWYRLGNVTPADKAMAYLETIQNKSGGFYGSYGKGAQYFQDKEISWAVKFFLDAHYLRATKKGQ
jgi:malonyl-CoA O-methyltransferase